MWRNYKKRKLMTFYGDIFTRNCLLKVEQISKTPSFEGSSAREREQVDAVNEFAILTIDEYKEASR